MRWLALLVLICGFLGNVVGFGQDVVRRVREPEKFRKQYGLDKFPFNPRLLNQRIAYIEYGYGAITRENVAKYLPAKTKIIDMRDPDPLNPPPVAPPAPGGAPAAKPGGDIFSEHGQYMVQTHYDLVGHYAEGPQYFLFISRNTFEFTRAIELMRELDIDIVANTTNWEYNKYRVVQDAVESFISDTGAIWINPVPDTGGRVFSAQVPSDAKNGDFLTVDGKTGLRFHAYRDLTVDVIMTWDVSQGESVNGTDKDLDIFLYNEKNEPVKDDKGKPVGASLNQIVKDPAEDVGDGNTRTAREAFRVKIPMNEKKDGYYKLFITKKSGEFRKGQFVRVTINSERDLTTDTDTNQPVDPIDFIDANNIDEGGVPSSSPMVIAVADSSHVSARSTRVRGVTKPNVVLMQGPIRFTDDTASKWASNAGGAVFPAIVSIMLAHNPNLTMEDIISFATGTKVVQGVPVPSRTTTTTQTTTATNLATDLDVITLQSVKDRYQYVIDAMAFAQKTGERRLLFGGKHRTDNHYAVAIDQTMSDFVRDLEEMSNKHYLGWRIDFQAPQGFFERRPRNFEMYLRYTSFPYDNRGTTETGLVVYIKEGAGKYPWEINGENSNQYVEVRQAIKAITTTPADTNATTTDGQLLSTTRTLTNVWVPPTPEQTASIR